MTFKRHWRSSGITRLIERLLAFHSNYMRLVENRMGYVTQATPLWAIFHALVKVYQPVKFEVRNVICFKDIEWCQILKMGSRDPGH